MLYFFFRSNILYTVAPTRCDILLFYATSVFHLKCRYRLYADSLADGFSPIYLKITRPCFIINLGSSPSTTLCMFIMAPCMKHSFISHIKRPLITFQYWLLIYDIYGNRLFILFRSALRIFFRWKNTFISLRRFSSFSAVTTKKCLEVKHIKEADSRSAAFSPSFGQCGSAVCKQLISPQIVSAGDLTMVLH